MLETPALKLHNLSMNKFVKSVSSFFLDLIETAVIGLSFFLIVYLFLMQPHQVNGKSMEPTFQTGDYLLTDKISYRTGDPKRGDIIVFHAPPAAGCPTGTGCDFIKRVIAVPGETVSIRDGSIYVDNQKLSEEYLPEDFETLGGKYTASGSVLIGPDEYFAVGDNRSHSSDSRVWGPVNKTGIVGKAFLRYWPISKLQWIADPSY